MAMRECRLLSAIVLFAALMTTASSEEEKTTVTIPVRTSFNRDEIEDPEKIRIIDPKTGTIHEPHPILLPPKKENVLPDLSDPSVRKQLQCSVCNAVSNEIRTAFMERVLKKDPPAKKKSGKPSKPKLSDLDVAEVLDGFCERVGKEYGMMDLRTQPDWKKEDKDAHKGYWITSFFVNHCSEVVSEMEETMIKHFREHPDQFLHRICPLCKWKEKDFEAAEEQKRNEETQKAKSDAARSEL